MGAVEFKVNGTKELFIPGSESDYGLNAMVLFFNDIHIAVDVRVLVASHDDSVQSKALVESLGGRGAVDKSLHQFRTNLSTFLEAHSSVLFGKGGQAKVKDGENQLVLAIKELCSCGVIKAELTCDPTPLAWVRRDDHRVTLACKATAVVVEDVSPALAPCALAFSPPERTQAPLYPQWLVDCDAANVEHLPLFSDRGCSGVSRQDWQRGSLRISLAFGGVVMVRDVLAAAVLPNRQPAGALQGRRSRPLSTDQSIGWKHARIRIPSRPSCQG